MTIEINGEGRHYRDVIQKIGRENPNYTNLIFSGEAGYETFNEMYPHLSKEVLGKQSLLLFNVLDTSKAYSLVISDKKEVLDGVSLYKDTEELPNEHESYVVNVHDSRSLETTTLLVLVNSLEGAKRIAERKMRLSGWMKEDITSSVKSVSPERMLEIAKLQIDNGTDVGDHILRFGGLRNYLKDLNSGK